MAGDATVLVEFEERIDRRVNQRVIALARAIRAARVRGVRDVVPAYRTAGVSFDPLGTDLGRLLREIERLAAAPVDTAAADPAPVRVPVCYGGEHGPDLIHIASAAGLTVEEAIERHCAPIYRVFMIGFVPGFAYLGTVDDRLAVPRRTEPRLRVPAGSVGIAGRQTGIYPADTPGGWMLVGRTPMRPFDLARENPCLFKPGDTVQFYPIDPSEYLRSKKAPAATPERGHGDPSEGVRASGHAEPRPCDSEARHRRQFTLEVGAQRQCRKLSSRRGWGPRRQ
jgi:KipI family sensor histidine kinase inhibitor